MIEENTLRRLVVACAVAGASAAAQSQVIGIVNAGFEADFAPAGGFPVLVPAGWSLYDPGSIVDQNHNAVGVLRPAGTTFFQDPVPQGNNVALVYLEQRAGTTLAGSQVGLSQTLAANLQADTLYTLTASIGNIASGTGLGAYAGFGFADLSGFPGYRMELLAGGQVIAFDDNTLGPSIGEGRFATATLQFTAPAGHAQLGQALGIRLINLNATGNLAERAREVDFDAVSLVASAVPEPEALALWLGGLGLVVGWRARRRTGTAG